MSNQDPFSDPTSGGSVDRVDMPTLVDHLLLFYPLEYIPLTKNPNYDQSDRSSREYSSGIPTENGVKDAVITDIHDLTDGAVYSRVMILSGPMIGVLKRKVEGAEPMLAVLHVGEPKKKNWKPPYLLDVASDEQKDIAREYIANGIATPAAPVKDEFDL